MIQAVFDSSVLVSAFLKPGGTSAALLSQAGEGAFVLCLSPEIVAETAASLLRERHQRRLQFGPEKVARFCKLLGQVAERVEGELPQILAVTGDRKHLLPLGSYKGVRIVSASEFLGFLEETKQERGDKE